MMFKIAAMLDALVLGATALSGPAVAENPVPPKVPTGLREFVRNAVPTYDLNAIASVRAFQRSNGPALDGVVEPLTWRSLVVEPAPRAVSASSLLPAAPSETQSASLTVPVVIGEVATGLNVPWGLAFLPGGGALAAERNTGRIVRIAVNGQKTRVGIVPGVVAREEGGLLGLAPSPGFARDRLLYAYFTAAGDNRIVRMRYGSDGRLGPATVILAGIPKADFHNGGRLVFGPDRTLYASTGDATAGPRAQDLTSLGGKILRMTGNGRPAPGNPFKNSLVWSYGHRNIEGLAFDARGQLWASEFGEHAWDELNLIRKGGNYGWPLVEGRGGDKRFTDPVAVWRPAVASPSGIAVAAGAVWMASLRGTRLWRIPLTATGVGTPTPYLTGRYGRLRTVAAAPGGGLWLITSNTDGRGAPRRGDDRILRLALRPS
jgi:glucose/arabinose dehydrogenase